MDEFKPCGMRQRLIAFRADGTKDHVHRCTERTAEAFGLDITPPDCDKCGVRREILKAATRPLTKTDGAKPDMGGDGFCGCIDRVVVCIKACCGNTIDRRVCNSLDSSNYQTEVTPVICAQCPVRRTFS